MHLIRKTVYNDLTRKGIYDLNHANSVMTSCQFLKTGSLLSRGALERYGYHQTPQMSDASDKTLSLWFDTFTDTVDIHDRARRANIYGPVLFVIDTDILLESSTGRVWVTKCNPIKWGGMNETERWFQNKNDLEENLVKGTFDQMVVFRHSGGELPFGKYLKKIILDDPDHELIGDVDIYSMAYGALLMAMDESGLSVPIEKRVCRPGCRCGAYYDASKKRLIRMFSPSSEDI